MLSATFAELYGAEQSVTPVTGKALINAVKVMGFIERRSSGSLKVT
jgi:hypothetical protein